MADVVDRQTRSRMMAAIGPADTAPELRVRRFLYAMGFRFRLHARGLPGRPDIVLPRYRTTVFVHGCFWHRHPGCRFATTPATRREFWAEKLRANVERDRRVMVELTRLGWNPLVIWECESRLEERLMDLAGRIRKHPAARGRINVTG